MASMNPPSVLERNRHVFCQVFPSAQRPPNSRQYSQQERLTNTAIFSKRLENDSLHVLGVRNEQYALTPGSPRSFKSYFVACPSLSIITTPTSEQKLRMVSGMLNTLKVGKEVYSRLDIDQSKSAFAQVVSKVVIEFVAWSYARAYNSEVRAHLRFWVEHILVTWVITVLNVVENPGRSLTAEEIPQTVSPHLEQCQNLAFSQLWTLRVDELFDIVVDWDDTSAGIDDIRPLLTTPQARQYVAQKMTTALHGRLLHPGASTIEILRIYISTIRAFRRLDRRGVILGKISGRVRQYLRERDDTVKIVVAGLLHDVPLSAIKTDRSNPDILDELAWELQNRDTTLGKTSTGSDWNNMNWQPDPIDALPEQAKSAKHLDVIGSVISLFDSKDYFVKELQAMLAERLLKYKDDYDQETAVIEHMKIRFGDADLQACEVMLRDVLDSRRLDQVIRRDQGLQHDFQESDNTQEPELHAKILSRLFWPTLPGSAASYGDDGTDEVEFKPPLSILHQRNLYERGFENLKQTRKLTWNHYLGEVEIELTFADGRTYYDKILPYQAGVIYAFNDDGLPSRRTSKAEAITKSVIDLSHELNLPINLVRSACLLFVSRRVLTASTHIHDAFTVLEYLPPAPGTSTGAIDITTNAHTAPTHTNADIAASSASAAAAQAAADRAAEIAAQQAQKEIEAREKRAKMAIYQQFITAMLTNQGSMPLPRIVMMLGMVVPGGFPFSNEELREFLGGMIREGTITLQGNNYKKA